MKMIVVMRAQYRRGVRASQGLSSRDDMRLDEMIISLYPGGMTVRDIRHHLGGGRPAVPRYARAASRQGLASAAGAGLAGAGFRPIAISGDWLAR
jgi:hypothetical protein